MAESEKSIQAEELLEVLHSEPVEAEHPKGIEMHEWVFTNDKENPLVRHMFHMLYRAAFANKIGIMNAKNKETGAVEALIVGIDITKEGQVATWPLAKILTEEEQDNYAAPRGDGTYVEDFES